MRSRRVLRASVLALAAGLASTVLGGCYQDEGPCACTYFLGVLVACPPCAPSCDELARCPAGQVCQDDLCVVADAQDGGPGDGGVDEDAGPPECCCAHVRPGDIDIITEEPMTAAECAAADQGQCVDPAVIADRYTPHPCCPEATGERCGS